MKKSIVTMLFLMLGIVVFTSCGSKMDKTAEEFKNKIISHVGDLYDEKYQEKIAWAIYAGIQKYFGENGYKNE